MKRKKFVFKIEFTCLPLETFNEFLSKSTIFMGCISILIIMSYYYNCVPHGNGSFKISYCRTV